MRYSYGQGKEFDELVESFNKDESRLRCPFCGQEAFAYWNYDSDYYIDFKIECSNCSCRIEDGSWKDALREWNTRKGSIGLLNIGKVT